MELQQLKYVVALAEEQNFTRAAKRCFVVQSALSHQIKALEQELKIKLFERSSRRVELTPAGAAFLQGARASISAAERAVADARAAAGIVGGSLSIGFIPTVVAVDFSAVVSEFHQRFPEVKLQLQVGASDAFMSEISSGRLDVAFLGLADSIRPKGVSHQVLSHEQLGVVIADSHRFAHRERLSLGDLVEESFIDFPAGTPGRAQSDEAFAKTGLTRSVTCEVTSIDLMVKLVRGNLGICLLSPRVLERFDVHASDCESRAGIRVVPLADGPVRREYVAWSSFNPSPAAKAFVELVTAHNGGQGHSG